MEHSGGALGGQYGENLYSTMSMPAPADTCTPALNIWYMESDRYAFGSRTPLADSWPRGVGHFTAMVWVSTQRFGCGVGVAPMQVPGLPGLMAGCKVVACRYFPPGNIDSEESFRQNVLPEA